MYFIIVDHHRPVVNVEREEMKETELNDFCEIIIIICLSYSTLFEASFMFSIENNSNGIFSC